MAVAVEQMSSLIAREHNQQRAAQLAADTCRDYGGALVGYLSANLRCKEDANDLAQEVYVRIARHDDVNRIKSVSAFAFTIARNLLRDHSRRCATKLAASCVSIDDVALPETGDDPLQQLEADESQSRIDSVVDRLSPSCREAYLLSRNYHLSHAAIAEHMQISVSMVEKHIVMALKLIRSEINRH